jgi:agmatine deiminase
MQPGLPSSPPGFSLPAEWERHDATWIGWPHNASDWPGKFAPVPWVYAEIVRHLAEGESVHILVNSPTSEKSAQSILRRNGLDLARILFLRIPTDRGWTRDFGPIFVRSCQGPAELAVLRLRFNGWAKYPDWKKDARVHERVAAKLRLRLIPDEAGNSPFVLEGGAIDVNGSGALITTEECLLDQHVQTRNPGMTRAEVEANLKNRMGVSEVIWLGKGIAGDDTHGHVDDVARFVSARTVVLCEETNTADDNYAPLNENRERLEGIRLGDGSRLEIIRLPMPQPVYFDAQRLPASYANFYFSNAALLVPTFNDPHDQTALGILSEIVTDRPVIGICARDLVWGLGTLHCLTQQQPSLLD